MYKLQGRVDNSGLIFSFLLFFLIFSSPPPRSNVVIRYVTILAPADSPNTDGIDPGTCYNAIFLLGFYLWSDAFITSAHVRTRHVHE